MIIKGYIELYLENSKLNKAYGTYRFERDILKSFNDFCEKEDLIFFSEFGETKILGYIANLKGRNTMKNITINKHMKLLKQLHKYFEIENRFLFRLKRLREDILIPEIIDDKKLKTIFDYIENNVDLDNGNYLSYVVLINLLHDTGARISELLSIKKTDINLKERYVVLRQTKTRYERQVPFTKLSILPLIYLLKLRINSEYLFYNRIKKRKMMYNDVRYFFKIIKEKTDIDVLRPHMFRHTLATKLIDKGVPLNTVQALLGHADIQTTLRYVHTQFKKHQEIYNGVNIRDFNNKL